MLIVVDAEAPAEWRFTGTTVKVWAPYSPSVGMYSYDVGAFMLGAELIELKTVTCSPPRTDSLTSYPHAPPAAVQLSETTRS